MTRTVIDPGTGNLLVAGTPVFPIGLSDPPSAGSTAPTSGLAAWAEIADAGVNLVRNYTVWTAPALDAQLSAAAGELDAAPAHGLQVWLALAGIDNDLGQVSLLDQVVATFKGHPGLGAWKGTDEPALGRVPAAGSVAVYEHLHELDPDHPAVIIEAPRGPGDVPLTAAAVRPYAAACDVHGVDIYPVSVPPGAHAGGPPVNTDISVVGDMTSIIVAATRRKAIWTTLQIAWSGVFPPHPVVFPSLQQARFMAYDAIIAGARGLLFFGGQYKQVMNAADQRSGWNWTYWRDVQRPLLVELTDADHNPALLAPVSTLKITASAADIAISPREAGGFLYLITVRKSPTLTGSVRFSGLPAGIAAGEVLAHPGGNPARQVTVRAGAFVDPSPFGPHNARVYRFRLPV
jgi:hypothetical protein